MQRPCLRIIFAIPLLCLAVPALAQSNGSEYYKKGVELRKAGKFREAISAYSTAISLDSKDANAYWERGGTWFILKEYDKAIADLNQAIDLNPQNHFAYMTRGLAWRFKGDADKAIADYNQAVRLDPNLLVVYLDRGGLLEQKGEYDKAIADYTQVVKLNPNNTQGYNNIASLQATCPDEHIRDGQKAVENAKKAYQLGGGKPWQTISTLAAAYAETGDFDKAREWQTKAIAMVENDKSVKAKDIEQERSNLELYKQGKPYHEEPKKKIDLPADAVPPVKDVSAGAKQEKFEKLLAEKPVIPDGVVYKKAAADINRKAFDKLWQVFVAGDRKAGIDDLAGDMLICGPGLWHNIKDDPEMKKLKLGVTKIKVPTNNGVQELDGKLFQKKGEVKDFWKAFWRKYKPDPQAKIRRPTARELDLYWATIPYDITEPIFMIESKEATILAHFPDKEMKLGWIDDYKDVHFKGER